MPVTLSTPAPHVLAVEFASPKHNSLPAAELAALAAAFEGVAGRPEVRCVTLRSAGERTFCAGASFDELRAVDSEAAGTAFFGGFARVLLAMRACPVPIVGRVQGKAVGGGVGLLAACDLAYGTPFAAVRLSELAIGIGPSVIGPAVERKTGAPRFAAMLLNPAEWFDARSAKECDLLTDVLDDLDAVDHTVGAKAEELAGYHPAALREMTRMLWEGTEHWPALLAARAEVSGRLVATEWVQRGLRSG